MKLAPLQAQISWVYDFDVLHPIDPFLLHDADTAAALVGNQFSGAPEQLLLAQDGENLEISLFLQDTLIESLSEDSPQALLHEANFDDFMMAVEGVSHFVHTLWSAGHDRCITQFELELIAEIDKFLTATRWITHQRGVESANAVHDSLFSRYRLRSDLSSSQKHRYNRASQLASQYCLRLLSEHSIEVPEHPLLNELRRFCRLSKVDKIQHIRSL